MFTLDPNPEFWTGVRVRLPGEAGATQTFRARFRALSVDAFNQHELASPDGTKAFLEAVLVDFDEVEATDGSRLSFTVASRDRLIDILHVRTALVQAYVASFSEAAAGN